MDNPLVQVSPGLAIWTILTFLVLLFLLKKYAWGPLLKALEERRATIEKSVEDAKRATAELQQVQVESARLLALARTEASGIVTRSRADAERLGEELRAKARDEAAAIVKNAQKEIHLETARAVAQIRTEAVELSLSIATKLLRRNISAGDNEALINEAIGQFKSVQ
ncbi:MAG TPA: F0F1 ATP synthase subunit B [Vicinamibacterales bacterium]|nr:F0F1 ATP synthase subunit B [Acidobacteriota bacterium]HQX80932.1 F0F1 ATP synthase subunit B [Vicinamibacterales bacterium]